MTCGENLLYNPFLIIAIILVILCICIIIKIAYDPIKCCNENYADVQAGEGCVETTDDDVVTKYYGIGKNDNALYVKTNLDDDWKLVDNANKYTSFVKDWDGNYIAVMTDNKTRLRKFFSEPWTMTDDSIIGKYLKQIGNYPDPNSMNPVQGKYIAIGPDGKTYQRNGFTERWSLLNNSQACCISEIFLDTANKQFLGLSGDGRLHKRGLDFNPLNGWTDISNGDPVKIASMAKEGYTYYGVGKDDGNVYYKTNINDRWTKYRTNSNIPMSYINIFKERRIPF
ncbi:MAG: hypothetical protein Edafosvirus1_96 [Edafosvirus sp.]|uniref:Uncharacterized protein n=1 Tax=Edafosvirus sp. TaxID=2487765 RepID=A0A3G4ZS99_9VIRU|nr:MAG: hypothetical protein Edafosvirus1_96 [Edafosvirus sp.]